MPTPLELKLIHLAYRQAGLDEAQYHLILRNVAGVESAKELTQTSLEDVMATLEDSGFRHAGKPADYWRSKVAMRGSFCGARMEGKIKALAAQQTYDLPGLCRRFSDDRVARVDKLMPREAHRLIEALKAICARQASAEARQGAGDQTSRPAGAEPHRPGPGQAESACPGPPAIQAGGIRAVEAAGGLSEPPPGARMPSGPLATRAGL